MVYLNGSQLERNLFPGRNFTFYHSYSKIIITIKEIMNGKNKNKIPNDFDLKSIFGVLPIKSFWKMYGWGGTKRFKID